MFTRSRFQTPDMGEQGKLLAETAALLDAGKLKSIVGERIAGISAEHLRQAHLRAESGSLMGETRS